MGDFTRLTMLSDYRVSFLKNCAKDFCDDPTVENLLRLQLAMRQDDLINGMTQGMLLGKNIKIAGKEYSHEEFMVRPSERLIRE